MIPIDLSRDSLPCSSRAQNVLLSGWRQNLRWHSYSALCAAPQQKVQCLRQVPRKEILLRRRKVLQATIYYTITFLLSPVLPQRNLCMCFAKEPLSLTLRGRSLRPVCHFALQECPDYLQRRQSHLLANELGQQGLAIEATSVRVLEVMSRGTHVRNTRRCVMRKAFTAGLLSIRQVAA